MVCFRYITVNTLHEGDNKDDDDDDSLITTIIVEMHRKKLINATTQPYLLNGTYSINDEHYTTQIYNIPIKSHSFESFSNIK